MAWYAIRCNPKCERRALRDLLAAGFDAYLPEQKIERFNRRLKVKVVNTVCLFPRYLFAQMEPEQFGAARACNGVRDILPGRPRDPEPVPTTDVLTLREAQDAMLLDDTDAARRRRGETTKNTLAAMRKRLRHKQVRVTDGPFSSFYGTVDVVHSFDRLKVLIDIFGRETPVELEMGQIEELANRVKAA